MTDKLHILLVEDNPGDADLIREMLPAVGPEAFEIECVSRLSMALASVKATRFAFVLLDLGLPDSQGLDTILAMRRGAPDLPIVVLTGNQDEKTGLAAIKNGAQDYLVKGQFESRLLIRSIRYAIERKQVEDSLVRMVQEWQRTFDAMHEAVWILDKDQVVVRSNKAAETYFHMPCSEMVGKHCWEIVHGTTQPIPECPAMRARKSLKNEGEELQIGTGCFDVSVDPILDADGKFAGAVHVISDISARKLAEKRIVEKEAEIRLLLDSTAEAIYGLDMNGNCTFCNNACLRLLGYTLPGELLGKNMHRQIHSRHPDGSPFPAEDCPIFRAFKKGDRVHVDDEVLWHADGTSFPAEYWSFPQYKDGVVIGAVVTFLNIAERKGLEAEKRKLEEQSRQLQKVESLGRMAGAIAHHFNNQLQVVQGYLGMVIDDLPPGDSHIEELTTAMQAAKTASGISSLMIGYLGQNPIKLEVVDIAELCRMNLPILQEGKPAGVVLELELPSPGPVIKADANLIKQILATLVINAFESIGDRAGTVHVSVKTVSRADIPASRRFPIDWTADEHSYACLEILDSGCGIRQADFDRLFEPFFSTKFIGRGMGLPVALGIMRSHNGGITVENRLGGGSVFNVFFPLAAQTAPVTAD